MDIHEKARSWIDRRLAAEATDEENRVLNEHLAACDGCRRSLEISQRALRGLGELTVEIDPGLTARVQAAIARRARDLEQQRAHRRTRLFGFAVALLMTAAGSLAVRALTPPSWTAAVLIFWMLPSLCAAFALLAPPPSASILRKREVAS